MPGPRKPLLLPGGFTSSPFPSTGTSVCPSMTFSRIAFVEDGVVGLDIRSHQQYTSLPFPVFTQGNEAQDAGCRVASANPSPPDVRYPSSGPFAWAALDGRMVTGPIRPCIRHILRAQSIEAWRSRPVQGLLPRLLDQVFTPTLDVSIYTQCNFTTAWSRWLLPADSSPLDLSAMAFRLHRAIGGSWTECLHAHATEATVASQWAARVDDPSHRTCPLCRQAPGTPRHVVMGCTALAPLVNLLRDDMERDLAAIAGSSHLLEAARRWQTSVQRRGGEHPPSPPPSVVERWPILAAWRWLVPIPAREALLSQDVAGSSAASANKECGTDLAYRGVLPKALGVAICHLSPASLEDLELEQFASLRNSRALQSEIQALARRQRPFLPAAQCCQRLVVGLRFIRSAYHARGSEASGVGFAWSKFSAFASDWDSALPAIQDPRIHQNGATVTSWDTLLGKRGTVADRHTLAAQDLVTKLEAVRHRLACKCCSWDEGRAMIQWILGGSLGYAPLVGLPSPATLTWLNHLAAGVLYPCWRKTSKP